MTEAKAMITSASSIATKVFKILLSAGLVSRTGAQKREPVPSFANWVHSLSMDGAAAFEVCGRGSAIEKRRADGFGGTDEGEGELRRT